MLVQVEYQSFNSVLSLLSYLLRTPLVPDDTPSHINTLSSQRACVENVFRACIGLAPINHMLLEHKHEASGSKVSKHLNQCGTLDMFLQNPYHTVLRFL